MVHALGARGQSNAFTQGMDDTSTPPGGESFAAQPNAWRTSAAPAAMALAASAEERALRPAPRRVAKEKRGRGIVPGMVGPTHKPKQGGESGSSRIHPN
jgi:hypothetical protein